MSWLKVVFPGWVAVLSVHILVAAITRRTATAPATTVDASVE